MHPREYTTWGEGGGGREAQIVAQCQKFPLQLDGADMYIRIVFFGFLYHFSEAII
jgi:hypothetical protein